MSTRSCREVVAKLKTQAAPQPGPIREAGETRILYGTEALRDLAATAKEVIECWVAEPADEVTVTFRVDDEIMREGTFLNVCTQALLEGEEKRRWYLAWSELKRQNEEQERLIGALRSKLLAIGMGPS